MKINDVNLHEISDEDLSTISGGELTVNLSDKLVLVYLEADLLNVIEVGVGAQHN